MNYICNALTPRHMATKVNNLSKTYKWELIFLLWIAFFLNQGDRQVFNTVLPQIQAFLGVSDGVMGIPTREQIADVIQGGVQAQKMLNQLYKSGMTAKAVLQYTGGLNDASVEALKKGIQEYAAGKDGSGSGGIIPIPLGFTLTPLNIKLTDSQFLELKQYSALQIAAAFGIKTDQIGDYTKSSYASSEAQQISFLIDTMLFIVKQYEEEITEKHLTEGERDAGYMAKFNTRVLLRADQLTQINTIKKKLEKLDKKLGVI